MENYNQYRQDEAEKLLKKRGKDGINTEEAYRDLEKLRDTAEYKEAEYQQNLARFAIRLAKIDEGLELETLEKKESIPIEELIQKYNISEVTQKLDRKTLEEKLVKAETREDKYKILAEEIGHTPLLEFKDMLPNGNKLYVKLESENGLAHNHYMRVYYDLIKYHEEKGDISPGDELYDYTTGSSGSAMAAISKMLGYRCILGMPEGGHKAREKAIYEWGAEINFSDKDEYIKGAKRANAKWMIDNRKKDKPGFFLSHAMKDGNQNLVNEVSTNAVAVAVDEIKKDLSHVDVFIPVAGNGTTQYGYGKRFKEFYPNVDVFSWETFESGHVYSSLYSKEEYFEKFGLNDDTYKLLSTRPSFPGTATDSNWRAPALEDSVPFLSGLNQVWTEKIVKKYRIITHRDPPSDAVLYNNPLPREFEEFGHTTRASYQVAKKLAQETRNKNYVIFSYDHADRYDSK